MQAGRKVWLQSGQRVTVGRAESADFAFASDGRMSAEHFVIECLEEGCQLRDLDRRRGITVNGKRTTQAKLADGDRIVAGDTVFAVSIQGEPPGPPPDAGPDQRQLEVPRPVMVEQRIQYFRQLGRPLLAILDAARDPLVLAWLIQSDHQYQSLYEGPKGEALAAVAPYLVELPLDSPFLPSLVEKGWGHSWGVYLTCDRAFSDVRRHLRRFLMVKTDEGKEVYFRFYDPRVLRVFLPTCLPDQAEDFFGVIDSFYLEGETPTQLLRFAAEAKGAKELVPLPEQAALGLGATVEEEADADSAGTT
jgi:hypothetical protein